MSKIKAHEYFTVKAGSEIEIAEVITNGCSINRTYTLTDSITVCSADSYNCLTAPEPATSIYGRLADFYRELVRKMKP